MSAFFPSCSVLDLCWNLHCISVALELYFHDKKSICMAGGKLTPAVSHPVLTISRLNSGQLERCLVASPQLLHSLVSNIIMVMVMMRIKIHQIGISKKIIVCQWLLNPVVTIRIVNNEIKPFIQFSINETFSLCYEISLRVHEVRNVTFFSFPSRENFNSFVSTNHSLFKLSWQFSVLCYWSPIIWPCLIGPNTLRNHGLDCKSMTGFHYTNS